MTLKELAEAILKLPPADRVQPALVWPPTNCPATQAIPVTAVVPTTQTSTIVHGPLISLGKLPFDHPHYGV